MSLTIKLLSSCRVSSVLNKDVKTFGKNNLFDGDEETCWNSDKGNGQWIELIFIKEELIQGLRVQFQGGFVGKKCTAVLKEEEETFNENFYPDDSNHYQHFIFSRTYKTAYIKLVFEESTDLFGRIVIYSLETLIG